MLGQEYIQPLINKTTQIQKIPTQVIDWSSSSSNLDPPTQPKWRTRQYKSGGVAYYEEIPQRSQNLILIYFQQTRLISIILDYAKVQLKQSKESPHNSNYFTVNARNDDLRLPENGRPQAKWESTNWKSQILDYLCCVLLPIP